MSHMNQHGNNSSFSTAAAANNTAITPTNTKTLTDPSPATNSILQNGSNSEEATARWRFPVTGAFSPHSSAH